MRQRDQRRKLPIVDSSLQIKFLVVILIYSLLIIVFVAVFLFLPEILVMAKKNVGLGVWIDAALRTLSLHSRLWPSLIVLFCVLGILTFRAFLKFIGPLYRLRLYFRKVSRGDMSVRMKIRSKDYLIREAELFNEMLEVLSHKWGTIQSAGQDALNSLTTLERLISELGVKDESLGLLLQEHRAKLKFLAEQYKYFKLTTDETESQNNR